MKKVLIPLAEGFEELEAVTVIDLLRRAGIEVTVAGLEEGPVAGSRGTVIVPDVPLDRVAEESFDMIVLPGGLPGADNLDRDPRIHALLERLSAEGRYTAAICAAPRVLAHAGLLDGRRATAYPGILDPAGTVLPSDDAVVRDGQVITSRGPGTAMDFALSLIGVLAGDAVRQRVESGLVRPPSHRSAMA